MFSENFRKLCATTTQHKNLNDKTHKLYKCHCENLNPYMAVLMGLNIFISSFNRRRQFRAIAGTTCCLAACHSLVGSTPASCFRGHIFNFHLWLAACVKYFNGFPKYLQTVAWIVP